MATADRMSAASLHLWPESLPDGYAVYLMGWTGGYVHAPLLFLSAVNLGNLLVPDFIENATILIVPEPLLSFVR
jgi:Na+(H+)/acetate symporter ActP